MFLSTRRRGRADNLRTKPPTMPLFYSSSKVSVAHLYQLNDFGINLSQEMLMRPTRERPDDRPASQWFMRVPSKYLVQGGERRKDPLINSVEKNCSALEWFMEFQVQNCLFSTAAPPYSIPLPVSPCYAHLQLYIFEQSEWRPGRVHTAK